MPDTQEPSQPRPDPVAAVLRPGWYFARRHGDPDRELEVVAIEATPEGRVAIAVVGESRRLVPGDFAWLTPVLGSVLAVAAGARPPSTSLDVLEPCDHAAGLSRQLGDIVKLMAAIGYPTPSARAVVHVSLDGTTVGVHLSPSLDTGISRIGTAFAADTIRWARSELARMTR